MSTMTILVTGSSGLIGSEAVEHFDRQGHKVHGVDNNMRQVFFGAPGDTTWNLDRLRSITRNFTHHNLDIRDRLASKRSFGRSALISSFTARLSPPTTRHATFPSWTSK